MEAWSPQLSPTWDIDACKDIFNGSLTPSTNRKQQKLTKRNRKQQQTTKNHKTSTNLKKDKRYKNAIEKAKKYNLRQNNAI